MSRPAHSAPRPGGEEESAGARFRALMERHPCLVTPGCYDALSARLAEAAGFEAISVSGFGVEASLLGHPDLGLLTLPELTAQAGRIAETVRTPVTCDGETGFGGVHNVARLVRELEARGLAGVQLEDQAGPKRCPALEGRSIVAIEEQLARLGAALAARRDPDFLVIARSDADVVGYEELVLRCNRYLQAGADIAMPIAFVVDGRPLADLTPDDQMELFARLARDIDGPIKGVLIPDGYTADDMAAIGYRVLGLTGGPIEAAVNALYAAFTDLRRTGSESAYRLAHPPRITAPAGVMQILGLAERLEFERRFAAGRT